MTFIMEISSLLSAIFCIYLLFTVAIRYLGYASPELKKVPGPVFAVLTSYYRVLLLWGGEGPCEHYKLHQKYGPVVRIGPNHVLVSDPAKIQIIYDSRNKFLKSRFYDVFSPLYRGVPLDSIFSTRDPNRNKALKQPLIANMTGSIQQFQSDIDHSVRTFAQAIHNRKGQSIDLAIWIQYWAFDLTWALIVGNYFGFMESGRDLGDIMYKFNTSIRSAALLGQVPEWCPWTLGNSTFMAFLNRFTSPPDVTRPLLQLVEDQIDQHDHDINSCAKWLLYKVIGQHRSKLSATEYTDAVNLLFETWYVAIGADDPTNISLSLAGSTEVAVAASTTIYCLLTNPSTYIRLIQEIESKCTPENTNHILMQADLLKFPYLDATLKESMRLYPSNCPAVERLVPAGGMSMHGYHFPAGTNIAMSAYAVHRDTSIYGSDAHRFRPERWLDAEPATLKRMEAAFMSFGKGSRACVGKELGMLELRMFMVMVLRHFDVMWAEQDTRPCLKMYWLVEFQGLDVRFKVRSRTKQRFEQ